MTPTPMHFVCRRIPARSSSARYQAGLPRYPLPTAHLGRLAVDLSCRGQRLASCSVPLPENGVRTWRSGSASLQSTCSPKDDDAKRFYLKYGFNPLQDDTFPPLSADADGPGDVRGRRRRVRPMRPNRVWSCCAGSRLPTSTAAMSRSSDQAPTDRCGFSASSRTVQEACASRCARHAATVQLTAQGPEVRSGPRRMVRGVVCQGLGDLY